jgi:lipopolysaccharide/colanic/teichoic acid biosynthesis glycosyltransferase
MIRPSSREAALRQALAIAGDFAVAWGALGAITWVRRHVPLELTSGLLPPGKFALGPEIVVLFTGSFVAALGLAGFYRQRITPRTRPLIAAALVIQLALLAIAGIVLALPLPRTILLGVLLGEALLFALWRALLARTFPIRPRETVIVGATADVGDAVELLAHGRDRRLCVTGALDLDTLHLAEARRTLRDAEEVICVSPDTSPRLRLELLRIRGPRGYLLLASHADALLSSRVLGWIGDQPLVEIAVGCGYGISAAVKRAVDVALGSIALLATAPLFAAAALAIWLEDRRPVLIRQQRVGRAGVPFAMWKFRSMRGGRATRAGSWMRRYRVDELPQLLNVLSGDMSLVGPRPERPELVEQILSEVPDFDLRSLVRPGIAGLAQVAAEYDTRPEVKLRYDLTYMCGWSLWLDLRLLLRGVATSLSGNGV